MATAGYGPELKWHILQRCHLAANGHIAVAKAVRFGYSLTLAPTAMAFSQVNFTQWCLNEMNLFPLIHCYGLPLLYKLFICIISQPSDTYRRPNNI